MICEYHIDRYHRHSKYPLGAGSEVALNNQTAKISTGEAIPVSPNKQIVGKF